MTDAAGAGPSRHREAFWSLVVGLPAAFSVLRMWVESGGDLQVTLLLVANTGPLNLAGALFATITRLVTGLLIALAVVGAILRAAVVVLPPGSPSRSRAPLALRVAEAAPTSLVVAAFVLALLTWKILYLPLLAPAIVAVTQHAFPARRRGAHVGVALAALAGYGWLVAPSIGSAWASGETVIAALLAGPPLVALGIAGPTPSWFARVFAPVALVGLLAFALVALSSAIRTPILPLTVTEVRTEEGARYLRGHIITINDKYLILLQERGGVQYIDTADAAATVLCSTPLDIPAFTTRIRGFHVEDSLLSASGRLARPQTRIDPLCRLADPSLRLPPPPASPTPSLSPSVERPTPSPPVA